MRIKELLAWAASVCLVGAGVFWYSGTFSIHPSYAVASEVADQEIAALNKAAPKFPRRLLLSANVKVILDKGHGSGWHHGNGWYWTAAHVVAGESKRLDLRFADGSIRKASIMWVSKTYDVALLKADGDGVDAAPLNCTMPKVGDDITLAGNPVALENITAFGRIAGDERSVGPWKSVLVVSAPVIPGQSGGPVYDRNGQVVGMSVGLSLFPVGFASASATGYGFIVPGRRLCDLVTRS